MIALKLGGINALLMHTKQVVFTYNMLVRWEAKNLEGNHIALTDMVCVPSFS